MSVPLGKYWRNKRQPDKVSISSASHVQLRISAYIHANHLDKLQVAVWTAYNCFKNGRFREWGVLSIDFELYARGR